MLTYNSGIKQAPSAAAAYAAHLMEQTVPADEMRLAEYYLRTTGAAEAIALEMGAVPTLRGDVDPRVAKALGLDPGQFITEKDLSHILAGYAADGADLPGSQHKIRAYKAADGEEPRYRNAYFDLCLSAPKSLSVAWAFAETPAERNSLLQCHRVARDEALRYIEQEIAHAHLGHGRDGATERGSFAWITVDHFTARPTVEVTRADPVTGVVATELHTVSAGNRRVAGDPQMHSHCIVPNMMVTESGRYVSINGDLTKDRIKEFGVTYQMVLARELEKMGVDVELCPRTRMARLGKIPERVCEEFSKRTRDAEGAARSEAARRGLDWDSMDPDHRVAFLKGGAGASRRSKADDMAQFAQWKAQAARLRWSHRTAVRQGEGRAVRPVEERLERVFQKAQDLFDGTLTRSAVVQGTDARVAAAQAFIHEGGGSAADLSTITRAMVRRGVRQHGQRTRLKWHRADGRVTKMTTDLHEADERALIGLAQRAAADKRSSVDPAQVDAAAAALDIRFTGRTGEEQRTAAHAMAQAGKLGVFIGVAGVGKTTRVLPGLVKAWRDDGQETWGTAVAWRQARELQSAGIERAKCIALAPLLAGLADGTIGLTERSVVVLDEVSLVGTRQLLRLLQEREKIGFKLVLTGDERQCQSIDAGPTLDLLRKALGDAAIPEILSTVRQQSERERETATMFRNGAAKEALERKRADNTAELVPGGYQAAVARVAQLAADRRAANQHDPEFRLTISAPTNLDAHNIGLAVRAHRRAAGEITGPDKLMPATDGAGNAYTLPLAKGDKVRLFGVTRAVYYDAEGRKKPAAIGDNGSVREVAGVQADGVRLLNPASGKVGFVSWEALTDKGSGRIRLALGEALTIHSSQGTTSDEHISAMPGGSKGVQGFQAYVSASRHRVANFVVGSMGAELREMEARRPLGAAAPEGEAAAEAAWANVARNLGRMHMKETAISFLEGARQQATQAAQAMQAGLRTQESRAAAGKPSTTLRNTFDAAQAKTALAQLVTRLETAMQQRTGATDHVERATQQAAARQDTRPPRPRGFSIVKISEGDAAIQLKAALKDQYGITIEGMPVLDGRLRYGHVTNAKGHLKKNSAGYRVKYEGIRPAGTIYDWTRGGRVGTWKADGEMTPISDEEMRERVARAAHATAAAAAERERRENRAAREAVQIWTRAKPASPTHPYLLAKQIGPAGARQDRDGNLVIPLRNVAGELRSIQWIAAPGVELMPGSNKKFLFNAQKLGVFFITGDRRLNDLPPSVQLGAAEGFATAETAAQLSGRPVAMVMDTSNIGPALHAIRAAQPGREIWIVADNDHHLPLRNGPVLLRNEGREKAEKVGAEIKAAVLLAPELPERAVQDKGTDWNDYRVIRGLESARQALRGAWQAARTAMGLRSDPAIPPASVAARHQRQGPRAHT